ncbi:N-acetylmannosamine-6-phosphate 2-epimerase, partial [Escherichia coli]|nr:N-acetylmannosamine-6-phosphate 2-epimerase [Escherichia coli]
MGNSVMEKIKGGLVVSCQALEDEPLHSAFI